MNRGRDLSTSAHLRVRLARLRVVALADDVAVVVHDDAAHERVRMRLPGRRRRELERAAHVGFVFLGVSWRGGRTDDDAYGQLVGVDGGVIATSDWKKTKPNERRLDRIVDSTRRRRRRRRRATPRRDAEEGRRGQKSLVECRVSPSPEGVAQAVRISSPRVRPSLRRRRVPTSPRRRDERMHLREAEDGTIGGGRASRARRRHAASRDASSSARGSRRSPRTRGRLELRRVARRRGGARANRRRAADDDDRVRPRASSADVATGDGDDAARAAARRDGASRARRRERDARRACHDDGGDGRRVRARRGSPRRRV